MPSWKPLTSPLLLASESHAQELKHDNSSSNATISIPYQYTYLLPDSFVGHVNSSFVNGNTTSDLTINSLLQTAAQAPFISYDDEFLELFGHNTSINLIQTRDADNEDFAYEAGVWISGTDRVWFMSSPAQAASRGVQVSILDLATSQITSLNTTGAPFEFPDGGFYFQGAVYLATYPDNTTEAPRGGSIVKVDTTSHHAETIINSYFGLPFNSLDDLVWATSPQNRNVHYLFFTDLAFATAYFGFADPRKVQQLPNGVWRWDPQEQILLQVISRNEIAPNGIRVSPDDRMLYITNSGLTQSASSPDATTAGASESWLGPYIYAYDLNAKTMLPYNRRVFGVVRTGVADGIHVDGEGRVWTAVGDGIVVRNGKGKVLGVVDGQYFLKDKQETAAPLANFALAGRLVVLAGTRLYVVQLAKAVVQTSN